jgi:hypothetical protein
MGASHQEWATTGVGGATERHRVGSVDPNKSFQQLWDERIAGIENWGGTKQSPWPSERIVSSLSPFIGKAD